MAEDAPKKKTKIPVGAILWGTVGIAAAVRALYRPDRALIRDGFVTRCAGGSNCDPTMAVESFEGQQPVFAPMRCVVVATGQGTVYLVPKDEPVVLEYVATPGEFNVQIAAGDSVGAGQQIGLASRFKFGVYELDRNANGTARLGRRVEPASWLAIHGLTVSSKKHKSDEQWCEKGRKLVVPQDVSRCNLRLPAPSGFALMPISVTSE